jgi:hypothetical protein
MKRAETTKVILKTSFSSPLRVKEAEPPPIPLANPLPLACIVIRPISRTANVICRKIVNVAITNLLYFISGIKKTPTVMFGVLE